MTTEESEPERSRSIAHCYRMLMADGIPLQAEEPIISPFMSHEPYQLVQVPGPGLGLGIYVGSATLPYPTRSTETAGHTQVESLTTEPSSWVVFVQGPRAVVSQEEVQRLLLKAEELKGVLMMEFVPSRIWRPQGHEHELAAVLGTDIIQPVHFALAEYVDLQVYVGVGPMPPIVEAVDQLLSRKGEVKE